MTSNILPPSLQEHHDKIVAMEKPILPVHPNTIGKQRMAAPKGKVFRLVWTSLFYCTCVALFPLYLISLFFSASGGVSFDLPDLGEDEAVGGFDYTVIFCLASVISCLYFIFNGTGIILSFLICMGIAWLSCIVLGLFHLVFNKSIVMLILNATIYKQQNKITKAKEDKNFDMEQSLHPQKEKEWLEMWSQAETALKSHNEAHPYNKHTFNESGFVRL